MADQAAEQTKDGIAALKAAFELAAQSQLVKPEDNAKKIKSALKDAKKLLAELRGEPIENFFDIDSEDREDVPLKPAPKKDVCPCCHGTGEHYKTGYECYGCDASGLKEDFEGDVPCGGREDSDELYLDDEGRYQHKESFKPKATNANITPDEQRQIDLATEQFRQSVERVDNQVLQRYIQAIQDGDYAEAERILEEAETAPQVNTLMFALLTIGVILLPLYARQRLQRLLVQFGLNTVYAQTDDGQKTLREQAEKGAKSHIRTISKDIKNSLDDAIDEELTNPVIEAAVKEKYDELADKDTKEYLAGVHNDERIYAYARDLILKGESRNTIIRKLQENFSTVGKRRANVIAANEANRVFTMSQYEADEQFLAQNQLTSKAYKRLVSNTGRPEAICKYIIDKTAIKPIPFKQDFAPFGKTMTVKGDNGKTYKFKPSYEHLKSGHIHVNCHCRYELLLKQDDGSFLNTFTWKNEEAFDEDKHKRDGKGRFAKKAGTSIPVDLTKLTTRDKFNAFVEEHYFEGDLGHYHDDVAESVRAYQGSHYDKINHHLRINDLDQEAVIYGEKTTYKKTVENINEAANLSLETDTTLYRGTTIPYHLTMEVGESIRSRSYLSSTTAKDVSDEFKNEGATLIITASKGQKVIIPDLVTYGKRGATMDEAEVLIPTDSLLTITKIDGEKVYVELS